MDNKLGLRDILVVLLLAVSYGLFFFSATPKYSEIVFPPDPKVEYHKNLANLYLTATDWETIHLLESVMVLDDLDDGLRQSVIAQNWKNFLRAPSHYPNSDYSFYFYGSNYYSSSDRKGKLLSKFQDHKAELFNIVTNRKSYPDDETMQIRRIEILEALSRLNKDSERLILLLSQNSKLLEADNLSELISIDNELYYNLDISEFCERFTIDENTVSCSSGEIGSATEELDASISDFETLTNSPVPLSIAYYFPHYTPKYNELVYLSYRNLNIMDFGESLIDMSFELLNDPKEDLYLRLLAMEKLSDFSYFDENRDVRKKYTDNLYNLLATFDKTGTTIDGAEYSNQEQSIFKIYILNHLASTIKAEKIYQRQTQESSK